MTMRSALRRSLATLTVMLALAVLLAPATDLARRQDAMPAADAVSSPAPDPCAAIGDATPNGIPGTPMATPGMGMTGEFDLMFIDLMIRHHEAAVAMAQLAGRRVEHGELGLLALEIVWVETSEIDQLRAWRDQWYPGAPAMPMEQLTATMGQMMRAMPGMEGMPGMDMMGMKRDSRGAVAALCAAPPPFDLACIDAMTPHHECAIAMARVALQRATHSELGELAQWIIDVQQREIDQLRSWRAAWYGAATPGAAPGAVSHAGPVVDLISLIDALRGRGLTVVIDGQRRQPALSFRVGRVLQLSGDAIQGLVHVHVYEYADDAAASADAAQIGPDGIPGTATVEWAAPPHFFRAGRVIVLYAGTDPAVIEALTALLGPQFAGRQRQMARARRRRARADTETPGQILRASPACLCADARCGEP